MRTNQARTFQWYMGKLIVKEVAVSVPILMKIMKDTQIGNINIKRWKL